MPPPARKASRRWLFRLGAIAFALGILSVAGEIGIRVGGIQVQPRRMFSPGIFVSDPDLGWVMKPNYTGTYLAFDRRYEVRINSLGFRGRELAATPPRERLLMIGDSNTFGLGVGDDECMPAQLERKLRAKDPTVEVVNTGAAAWNTAQEEILLAKRGLALRPTTVVLDWNTNDLDEDWQQFTVTDEGDLIKKADVELWAKMGRKKPALWTHSALLTFLNVKWRVAKHRFVTQREHAESFDPDQVGKESLEVNFAHVRRIRDLAKGVNARFLFLISPLRVEVERGVTGTYRNKIADFCKAEGIELLDELDPLRAHWAAHAQDLFVERDSLHLNALGNEVVSEALARWYRGS